MSFCKKSVHSFLGSLSYNNNNNNNSNFSINNGTVNPPPSTAAAAGGLSLFATTSDIQRPMKNVLLESTIFRTTAPSTSPPLSTTAGPTVEVEMHENNLDPSVMETSMTASSTATSSTVQEILGMKKKDYGVVIGFLDDMGGEIDGLMSCTESLGFESTDERRTEDHVEIEMLENRRKESCIMKPTELKKDHRASRKRQEKKKFPPPLSTLSPTGQPNFYLRAERKDGRLELTEVKIERPEIFRASRRDGRLRLQLIRDVVDDDVEEEEEEEEIEQGSPEEDDSKEEEKDIGGGEWKFPVTNSGGEGLRRCNELVNHHCHHHHSGLHVWSQPCVTIR